MSFLFGRAQALPTNIGLALKGLPVANTSAYHPSHFKQWAVGGKM
jgi:hypothetical protein